MAPTLRLELDRTGEARCLARGTLTIGRAAENDWVLPVADGPSVSRRHCQISGDAGGFSVTDLGSTNGTRVNGERLAAHAAAPLSSGDVIELGPFRLSLTIESEESFATSDPPNADALGASPFGRAPSMPSPPPLAAGSARPRPSGSPSLEDLLGSLEGEAAQQSARRGQPATVDKDPLEQFLNKLDPLPRPTPPGEPERSDAEAPSAPQFEALITPATRARHRSGPGGDPFALSGRSRERLAGPANQAGDVAPVAARSSPSPRPASDADTFVTAFLDGAGVDPKAVSVDDPCKFLRDAGAIFARMSDGLRELLAVRALIKEHARLNQTQIRALDNNPLKFAVDGNEATQALLQGRGRGYMPGTTAIDAACRDLMAHELALLEGIQAAIGKLLQSFDPTNLEALLADSGSIGLLLHGGRHAKLWELYGERYAEIAKAARARFMGDFNDAFRAAYERKVAEFAAVPKRSPRGGGE